MSIQMSANVSSASPGQTFEYTIQLQCTAGTVNGCVNAQVSDPLPRYISVNGIPTVSGNTTDPTIDAGPPVRITFNDDLGGEQIGLAPGNVIVIKLPVKVDDDIPVDASGQPLVNTTTLTADNATAMTHDAAVTPQVEPTPGDPPPSETTPPSGSESGTATTTAEDATSTTEADTAATEPPADTTVAAPEEGPAGEPDPPVVPFLVADPTRTISIDKTNTADGEPARRRHHSAARRLLHLQLPGVLLEHQVDCVDLTVVDTFPRRRHRRRVHDPGVDSPASATVTWDGSTLTVVYIQPLANPPGETGKIAGTSDNFRCRVTLPADTPLETGDVIANEATVSADNVADRPPTRAT